MATKITEVLIDDLDGSEAVETVLFTIGGSAYEVDLGAKNVAKLDKVLESFKARRSSGRASKGARRASPKQASAKGKTLFSSLDGDQKAAFRKWAKLPDARRIGDDRVQAWLDAGRPSGARTPTKKSGVRKAPAKRATVKKQG